MAGGLFLGMATVNHLYKSIKRVEVGIMQVLSQAVELGDSSYQITQFTATKGLRFFRMISKYAAPLIGLMSAKEGDGDAVSQAIEALMENLGDDKFDVLIKDMYNASGFVSQGDGQQPNFDFFFAGNYDKLITLITEIIKFNFGSVFQEGVFESLSAQMPAIQGQ